MKRRLRFVIFAGGLSLAVVVAFAVLWSRRPRAARALARSAQALFAVSSSEPSVCRGTPQKGSLARGWKLPRRGPTFRAYSDAGWMAGRTYVHSAVHRVVVDSYDQLAKQAPDKKLVYGETGFPQGGEFAPHKTHQNGLSVDFMVPLVDDAGRSIEIETTAGNRYGYDVELDEHGRGDGVRIDFETLALHLALLEKTARAQGFGIAKVIFDVPLRKHLERTRRWNGIRRLPFSTKPAWVRHDEHYHVDFAVPCG